MGTRDLALFDLAIDSKLAGGYTADRATVRQKKAGRPVIELSEQTRQTVDDYLKAANKRPGKFMFTGRHGPDRNTSDD